MRYWSIYYTNTQDSKVFSLEKRQKSSFQSRKTKKNGLMVILLFALAQLDFNMSTHFAEFNALQ